MRVAVLGFVTVTCVYGAVSFHPNHGQAPPAVRYLARTPDSHMWLEPGRLVLRRVQTPGAAWSEIAMRWIDGSLPSAIEPESALTSRTNYFFAKAAPLRNIPEFERVRYRGIYDGVDMIVYGNGAELEYDFEVAPGADPSRIALQFDGAQRVRVNLRGELEIQTPAGPLLQKKPVAWQDTGHGRRAVEAAWVALPGHRAAFRLGAHDPALPLTIDPVLRANLAGSGIDRAFGVAVDPAGNIYVSGITTSPNFPTNNAFKATGPSGVSDVFVAKYTPDLSRRIYSTYFGGSAQDDGTRIQVDAEGNAYVTGYTRSNDFPTTDGAFQRTLKGTIDSFVFKLSADGSRLIYSTLIGGSGDDYANNLLLDSSGAIAVAGFTSSTDMPVSENAAQSRSGGGNDVWIAILSADGATLPYLTYYGGSGGETINGLVLGQGGNLYFTGQTDSPNLPVDANAFRKTLAGGIDAYLARLTTDKRRVEFASYLGGSLNDVGADLTVDFSEVVRVVGNTTSTNFPVFPAGSSRHNGKSDIFVAQFHFPRPAGPPARLASATQTNSRALGLLLDTRDDKRPANEPFRCPYASDAIDPLPSYTSPCSARYEGTEEDEFTGRTDCSAGTCDYTYRGTLFDALYPDQTECTDYLTRKANRATDEFAAGVAGLGIDSVSARSTCIVQKSFFTDFDKTDGGSVFAGHTAGDDAFAVVATNTPAGGVERATIDRKPSGAVGHPISTATGEFWEHELDLSLGGPLPLSLIRYYGSALWDQSTVRSALGTNWMHNFDWRVLLAGANRAVVVTFRGKLIQFARAGTGSAWSIEGRDDSDFQFTTPGNTFQLFEPGDSLTYSFDSGGRLTRIEDLNGNALAVTPSANGPTEVSDGLGRSLRFTYSGQRLMEVADQTGRKVSFAYTGTNLTTATDPLGRATTYAYTTAANRGALMTRRTLPEGNTPFVQEYDARGRVIRQADSSGNALTLAFDSPAPRQTRITNPDGSATTHMHVSFFYLASAIDGAGNKVGYEYDLDGRQTGAQDRTGATSGDTFDAAGNLVQSTDALGNTTTHSYTQFTAGPYRFFRRSRTRNPDGTVVRYSYDQRGNLTAFTDRAGQTWSFSYTERGWPAGLRTPTGGTAAATFNTDGTVATVTRLNGETIGHEYDELKRLARVVRGDGTSRRYAYDATNRLTKFTDERGKEYLLTYDQNGRPTSITDPNGSKRQVSWNGDNRVSALIDPLGNAGLYTYDPVGRPASSTDATGLRQTVTRDVAGFATAVSDAGGPLVSRVNNAEGVPATAANGAGQTAQLSADALRRPTTASNAASQKIELAYDGMGRVTSAQNAASEATQVRYNAAGLPERITQPDGSQIQLAYNADSRLTRVVDANGQTWTVERDAAGRVIAATDPAGLTSRYEYTGRDRIAKVTHPDGSSDTYTYDEAGRLALEQYADGVQFTFTRDDVGRVTGSHNLALAYDANGRITQSNSIGTEYDPAGRIVAIHFAEGKTVRYEYNNRGRLARLTDWTGGVTDFDYDGARRLIAIRRPSGVSTSYSYGIDGRRSAVRHTGPDWQASVEVTRDSAGRIVKAVRQIPPAPRATPPIDPGVQDFTLTANRRLEGREYDAKGNLLRDGEKAYSFAGPNLLMSRTNGAGTATAEFDAVRNLTRIGNESYTWNYAVSLTSPAIVRNAATNVTRFLIQPFQRPLFSLSEDTATSRLDYLAFTGLDDTVITSGPDGALQTVYSRGPAGEPGIGSFLADAGLVESRGTREATPEELAQQVTKESEMGASGYYRPGDTWQYDFEKGGRLGAGGSFGLVGLGGLSTKYDIGKFHLGGFLNFGDDQEPGEPNVVGFSEKFQYFLTRQAPVLITGDPGIDPAVDDGTKAAPFGPVELVNPTARIQVSSPTFWFDVIQAREAAASGSAGTAQPLRASTTPAGRCTGSSGNVTTELFSRPALRFYDVSRQLAGPLPEDPETLSERVKLYRPYLNGLINVPDMRYITFGLQVVGSDAEAEIYNSHDRDGRPLGPDPYDRLKPDNPPPPADSVLKHMLDNDGKGTENIVVC